MAWRLIGVAERSLQRLVADWCVRMTGLVVIALVGSARFVAAAGRRRGFVPRICMRRVSTTACQSFLAVGDCGIT